VVKDTVAVLGSCLVLGVVCGIAWELLVEPATFTKLAEGGSMGEVELGRQFDGDGWYAVVAAVAGSLGGAGLTWWRSRDFLATTLLLVVGAGVAAAVMLVTGNLLGPGDSDAVLGASAVGDRVPVELTVTAAATYLVWPIAMLLGALMVLWSQPGAVPDAQPEDRPLAPYGAGGRAVGRAGGPLGGSAG